MNSLNRKLSRELWSMKGQALAISLVIASGIATFVMSLSTLDSLRLTQATYYRDYRFAEVFIALKRAPESLNERVAEIPGVEKVATRVNAAVTIDIDGFPDPVTGQLISVPDEGEPLLNGLYLRQGRFIEAGRDNEVVVSDAFAEAHGFSPGDRLHATINGKRKALTIVGIALTPEYILQIRPGSMFPDFKRYGILWMGRTPLATAYDMEGAFNDVALTLTSEAKTDDIIDRLDDLFKPYGGLGAYARKDQLSHRYLSEEFRQLGQMATIFPIIFLAVAAFLLNVVISRLINTQREEIAILKAFGYSNLAIGVHYLKLVMLIVLVGGVAGLLIGIWFGQGLSKMYMDFYRFPFIEYELRTHVVVAAAIVSSVAAIAGTLFSLRRAALLPPAEAMRPEPPVSYRETIIERIGLKRLFFQPTRMIIRHIERRPVKAILTITGIAFSCAIMMIGSFFGDAVDHMINVQFGLSQREDISVTFVEPTSKKALYQLRSLRGVEYGETFRAVPVRLKFQHRDYRTVIQGMESDGDLHRLLNTDLEPINLPPAGIVLTDYLGKILGVTPGDRLTVEVLEGSRPILDLPVAAFVSQYIGVSAYMDLNALNRIMGEGNAISGAFLSIDSLYKQEIYETIQEMPRVAGTVARLDAIRNFYKTMGEQVLIFAFINTLFAATIAFGVVYNSARISLSERGRELASLRVLGFTRGEISYILLGELTLLILAAIPIGFIIGRLLCAYMIVSLQTDLFRIPLVVDTSTYALSSTVVLVSGSISGLIVRRRLDHLDLVAVLKTKE
jgi:putative ABC transport system permease protein